MRITWIGGVVIVWLALAGGSETIVYLAAGVLGIAAVVWGVLAMRYIRSGQWEIDQRLRSL